MNIKGTLFCFFALMVGFTPVGWADDRVQDAFITTTDRTCGIHYLTHGNTVGWYLSEVEGSCPNGTLQGRGKLTLRNAFGKVVQLLDGYFIQGYPIQSDYGDLTLKTLLLGHTKKQILIYDLGQEERLDLRYLGQMSSMPLGNNTYSAFEACDPAIVLAVTPNIDLFEDETVQQEIINSVLNRLNFICPEMHQVYLYGSETDTPENKDISFFADINLNTGHIKVRRVPSSPRIRDVLADPTNNTDIPLPKEIRRETGLTVVQITPVKPEGKSFGVLDTPKNDIAVSSIPVVGAIPLSRDTSEIQTSGLRETSTSLIRTTAETMPVSVSRPSSEKETVQEEADSLWDDIPALLTAARLLKQPVDGKALVHIARFDSVGIALTDGPVILRLRGKNLPTGWVVISGHFTYTPMQNANDAVGFVDVQSFTAMSHKGEK